MILNIRNYFQNIRTLETEFLMLENACKISEIDFYFKYKKMNFKH